MRAGSGCFAEDTFDGWTVAASGTATFRPSVGAGQEFTSLPDGSQVAAISTGGGSGGEIFQDLSAVAAADTTYTLTFFVGQRSDVAFDSSYDVSLMANGTTLASDTGASPAAGTFVERTIVFSTGASPAELGKALRIDVFAPAGPLGQADFDLFSLDASTASPVPEPSSLVLLATGMGFGALGFGLRKRRV